MNHVQMLRSAKTRLWDGKGVQPTDLDALVVEAVRLLNKSSSEKDNVACA